MGLVESIRWRPAPHIEGARLLEVDASGRDWRAYHDCYEFCTIVRVHGTRGAQNYYRRWSRIVKPEDVLLMEAGEAHTCLAKGNRADFRVLIVPPEVLQDANLELNGCNRLAHFHEFTDAGLFENFLYLHTLCESVDPDPLEVQTAFVDALTRAVTRVGEFRSGAVQRVDDQSIRRALELMNDLLRSQPQAHLRLDKLALACGSRGKYALCRDFKRCLQQSPYAYWKLRKLSLAREALRAGSSIRHVAWFYGYDAASFSRQFQKIFHISPRQYQAAHLRD